MTHKNQLLSLAKMNKRDDIKNSQPYWEDVIVRLKNIDDNDEEKIKEISNNCFGLELSEIEEEYTYRSDDKKKDRVNSISKIIK